MLDLNIPIGHTKRLNCPICNGYKTFTATNNMGMLVWNCYKASCNIKGNTKVRLSADDIKNAVSMAGYSANEVAANPDSYEALPACCKGKKKSCGSK